VPLFDAIPGAIYIPRVAEHEDNLFDTELRQLEARMEEIVRVCDQLKEENRSLKDRQEALITERASLLQKNELVRGRVEAMIGRLKSMEHGG
jgi:cell division protein ZapB